MIGVTGGVGTGKSTVARIFRELGARVFDADRITHALMQPGTPVWRRIRRLFGQGVMTADGRIDRRRLGAIVFQDRKRLDGLCRVIHPAVRREIQKGLRRLRWKGPDAVAVLDIPLLMESSSHYRTDVTVVVSARPSTVAQRLHRRSGWDRDEIKRRSSFQLPLSEKERQADFVVNNGGSQSATRRQVVRIWKNIKGEVIPWQKKK